MYLKMTRATVSLRLINLNLQFCINATPIGKMHDSLKQGFKFEFYELIKKNRANSYFGL